MKAAFVVPALAVFITAADLQSVMAADAQQKPAGFPAAGLRREGK